MTGPADVLVVEDDERLAGSIRRALAYDGHRVRLAADGSSGLAAIRDDRPDVVVLDVMLPGVDGFEICRRVRAAGDDVAILLVTARDAVPDRVAGLDAGADDYLVKPFAHAELLARVRALLRRRGPAVQAVLRVGDLEVDVDQMTVRRAGAAVDVTAQEFRLLEFFARSPRVVLGRGRLLEAVWGSQARTASNVVDVYVGYLRRKLEEGGRPRLLHTVRGAGYVLREPRATDGPVDGPVEGPVEGPVDSPVDGPVGGP
jgi:two-component system response regulator MprA